jgi:hypothetical protein
MHCEYNLLHYVLRVQSSVARNKQADYKKWNVHIRVYFKDLPSTCLLTIGIFIHPKPVIKNNVKYKRCTFDPDKSYLLSVPLPADMYVYVLLMVIKPAVYLFFIFQTRQAPVKITIKLINMLMRFKFKFY